MMITFRFERPGIKGNDALSGGKSICSIIMCTVLALVTSMSLTIIASGTASAGVTQFTVSGGIERTATAVPVPPSGKEVVLTGTGSSASTTVSGSGRVIVGASGTYCQGWPTAAVYVGGVLQGKVTLTSSTQYGAYPTPTALSAGAHAVKIVFTNDRYLAGNCDRNINLATVRMEFQVSPTLLSAGATNTGVPVGTPLTVNQGDITVSKDGTVIDALDVHGAIYVKANNVTIKRSFVRGGPVSSKNNVLIASWWGYKGLRVEDSTLRADYPSYYLDGLSGANFTATRLDVSNVVDSVKLIGGNVTLTDSWLHGNTHFEPDPNQSDNKSHDDGVQLTGGGNAVITHNVIEGAYNSAIMIGQVTGVVSNVKINGNRLSDGACQVNVTQAGTGGGPISGLSISNNQFNPGRYGTTCPMRLPSTSPISVTGNVWDGKVKPAVPLYF